MNELTIENFHGHFICKELYNRIQSTCDRLSYQFQNGVYVLAGEIDSGGWAFASSLCQNNTNFLGSDTVIKFNGGIMSLADMIEISCDLSYEPVESERENEKGIRQKIAEGIEKYNLNYSLEEIKELFFIADERFDRPVHCVGNERYRCNAAVGYTNGKKIFCFPWLSKKMTAYHCGWLRHLCDIMSELDCIVFLPLSSSEGFEDFTVIDFPRPYDAKTQAILDNELLKNKIPKKLFKALQLYDNNLIKFYSEENDFYMHFNPVGVVSDTTKLIFKNAKIIQYDSILAETDVYYNEIHLIPEGYELRFVFREYIDGIWVFKYLTVQAADILYELRFRNLGLCEKCGRPVVGPSKEECKEAFFTGQYIDDEWYCNECLEKIK